MKKTQATSWKKRIRCLAVAAAVLALTACAMPELPFLGGGSAQETEEQPREEMVTPLADSAQPDNLNQAGYDVVYVIDNSKSVWGDQKVRNQAFKNITNLAVGSNNRIGVVYFADHVYESLALTSMKDRESCTKVLSFLENSDRDEENADTNIGNALETAAELFDGQDPSREKILILFSDGINENQNEDEDYKLAADAKTLEVVPQLEEMGIKLYCVFLQKDRTDEEYLHQVVNYFSEDNDYVEERFSKVTMDDLSGLSPAFADVFYKMQNNMKYIQIRKENLDSTGRKSFYLPAVGIKRLDIYLDGNVGSNARITAAGECENEMWSDGSASFYTFTNPVPGDWSITVDGTVPEDFFGTICCYTNLSAKIEMKHSGEEKNARTVTARFYDENGEQVLVDSGANASMDYVLAGEESEPVSVNMRIENGEAVSDGFALDQYGDYLFRFHLTYADSADEFVDLSYDIPYNYQNSAPVTYDMSGRRFSGKSVSGGLQTYIEESELFLDPDGDAVTITEVTQLSPNNSVEVTQSGSRIYLTAQKAGDFGVKLTLEDAGGAASEVKIEGVMADARVVIALIIAACAAVIFILFLLLTKKSRRDKKKKRFEKAYENVVQANKECLDQYSSGLDTNKKIGKSRKEIEGYIEQIGSIIRKNDVDEKLQKVLGVADYVRKGYTDDLFGEAAGKWEEIEELADRSDKVMETAQKEHEEEKAFDEAAIREMENHGKEIAGIEAKIAALNKELEAQDKKIREAADEIGDCTINDVMEEEIYCRISVRNIAGYPGVRGSLSNTDITGQVRTGCVSLGDAKLNTGAGTLGDLCESAGDLYIMGYYDEKTDREGVVIKGAEPFGIVKNGETKETSEKYLFSGDSAEIVLGDGIHMTVTAR